MTGTWSPKTLPQTLVERAERIPDSPLLRVGDLRLSAAALVEEVAAIGGALREAGVGPGDRVLSMVSNRVEGLEIVLASAWIGAIAAPVNVSSRGEQLAHIVANCKPSLVVAEEGFADELAAAGAHPAAGTWWVPQPVPQPVAQPVSQPVSQPGDSGDKAGSSLPRADRVAAAPVRPGDPATILYTSGTTGLSKGVLGPQAQLYWWGVNVSRQLGIRAGDVLHTALPLFHTNALNAFSQALVSDAEYSLGRRFSASRFWTDLAEVDATVTYLLGAMATILLARPEGPDDRRHQVRVALSPATPAEVVPAFRERFGVRLIDGWGSTETNSVINVGHTEDRPGSMGRVAEGFDARVVDADGIPVPPGVPGELVVRNSQPHAFALGYYELPQATVEAWQDLWFHSGDRVVAEEDGWFRFLDRIKDVIRRRGENISSLEVEQVLAQHPRVQQAAVYGVPSELGEEEVMAALVVEGEELTPQELIDFCAERLAYFAVPRFVRFCDALPVTDNGKVRKVALREAGAAAAAWDREALGLRLSGR